MKKTNEKGITLIALVITIIVMLILVAVVVAFAIGNDGVIGNSENAKAKTTNQAEKETLLNLVFGNDVYSELDGSINLKELRTKLLADSENWELPPQLDDEDNPTVLTVKGKKSGETHTVTNKGKVETKEEQIIYYMDGNSEITENNFTDYGYETYYELTVNASKTEGTLKIRERDYDSGTQTETLDDLVTTDVTFESIAGNSYMMRSISLNNSGDPEYECYVEFYGNCFVMYLGSGASTIFSTGPISKEQKDFTGKYMAELINTASDSGDSEDIDIFEMTFTGFTCTMRELRDEQSSGGSGSSEDDTIFKNASYYLAGDGNIIVINDEEESLSYICKVTLDNNGNVESLKFVFEEDGSGIIFNKVNS